MLELRNIKKNYYVADETVEALKGVDLRFRQNEFVAILGPSGCGKTTLLNIIGGLDRYTDGDLIIRGKSTKGYNDYDWDTYRNHTIGFVFQNYNLISHQTVLENVELALTLSGVSKAERRKRAIQALQDVGLGDKINNKPNQLSGGQMQRVAIARALVNNPDILLADEPTGALDTKTSKQIMDILKSISKNKLIIMVTHNPELAEEYANRIIRLVDGLIVDDTNHCELSKEVVDEKPSKVKKKKAYNKNTSMSFMTALSLSFKNLLTKKARTFMVAFAGSIGIIGIALILSVSNGFQLYIDKVQEDTLSTYPISIESETMDYSSMLSEMNGISKGEVEVVDGVITSNDALLQMVETSQKMLSSAVVKNDLQEFKKYIETDGRIKDYSNAVQYVYNIEMNIYDLNGYQVNPSNVFDKIMGEYYETFKQFASMASMIGGFNVWSEMLDNDELIQSQYDLLDGKWPTSHNEIVIVVDKNNQISDYVLYSLGLKDPSELENLLDRYMNGEEIKSNQVSFKYEDILNLKYKLVLPYQKYELDKAEENKWNDISKEEGFFEKIKDKAIDLEVVGILRPKDSASATSINGAVGYLSSLVFECSSITNNSDIMMYQRANEKHNVFTGKNFVTLNISREELNKELEKYILTLPVETQGAARDYLNSLSDEDLKKQLSTYLGIEATFEGNLKKLGYINYASPSKINIFPKDFESKDMISSIIAEYNNEVEAKYKITYSDYIGLFLSSITIILNVITYVLIAFVAISLVVSSIMIGVITYISVLERTKEIGILRSIGARKQDISRVFTAETVVVGFAAGAIGIIITLILIIPINLIINWLAGFPINAANLPVLGGILLIAISVILTVIAGLFPSKLAAKKDPVEALRSE